jgi:hypothetical protein
MYVCMYVCNHMYFFFSIFRGLLAHGPPPPKKKKKKKAMQTDSNAVIIITTIIVMRKLGVSEIRRLKPNCR